MLRIHWAYKTVKTSTNWWCITSQEPNGDLERQTSSKRPHASGGMTTCRQKLWLNAYWRDPPIHSHSRMMLILLATPSFVRAIHALKTKFRHLEEWKKVNLTMCLVRAISYEYTVCVSGWQFGTKLGYWVGLIYPTQSSNLRHQVRLCIKLAIAGSYHISEFIF